MVNLEALEMLFHLDLKATLVFQAITSSIPNIKGALWEVFFVNKQLRLHSVLLMKRYCVSEKVAECISSLKTFGKAIFLKYLKSRIVYIDVCLLASSSLPLLLHCNVF